MKRKKERKQKTRGKQQRKEVSWLGKKTKHTERERSCEKQTNLLRKKELQSEFVLVLE
jgi:hypothetical protein